MSKIDDVIAEIRRKEPRLPVWACGCATVTTKIDGGIFGDVRGLISRTSVESLRDFLNEWYADPAPATSKPVAGWKPASEPPNTTRDVIVRVGEHETIGWRHPNGEWVARWTDASGEPTSSVASPVTEWRDLPRLDAPAKPEPSAVA